MTGNCRENFAWKNSVNGIVQCLRPVRKGHGFALWEWAPKLLSASEAWKDDSYEICEKPVQVIIKRFYEHEAHKYLHILHRIKNPDNYGCPR